MRLGTVVALGLLATGLGCSSDVAGQSARDRAPESPPAKLPTQVRVSAPVPVAADDTFPSDVYVERDVWLTPRTTGIIERVLVDRGDRVREGQELVVMETDLQVVELRIAEHTLRYHEAESERTRTLFEQNIVSSLDALRDEIERDLAASELDLARARLGRCTVRAPFDGVIVERLAVPGQRVMEEEGARLVRIVADDRLRAKIHVPEERLRGLAVGQPAEIAPEAAPRVAHAARIVFISPSVDAASDTALVIVEAERRDPSMKVGSGVEVRLSGQGDRSQGLFRIPRAALAAGGLAEGSPATLLLADAGRVAERRVDLVELRGPDATVRGALGEDDRVIVGGGAGLAPGDPVEVRGEAP